jgi:DNA invertase Pin-like site-specific DNA recombinase
MAASHERDLVATLIRAAQYVRMSTDHQKYSIENQSVANHAYAASRGMEIVRSYADEGRSGLTFERRDALKRLISDVQTGASDFQVVLVYDVSRWGRFQDADESGYYEYVCKRAGVQIHYCAEQFENDGSPFAAIVKSIKRAMAAEYSRELSVKAFVGQSRIVRLGFRAGSSPAYGTRRLLVDHAGKFKGTLAAGEYKNLSSDRVVTVLGSPEEVRNVKWIFSAFVKRKKSISEIVQILNTKGVSTGSPGPWTFHKVKNLLLNEIYVGNSVWNRTSIKLARKKTQNPPDLWLRVKASFDPIVRKSQFNAAQRIMVERQRRLSKDEVLEKLRRLYHRHGFLDTYLINDSGIRSTTYLYKYSGGLRQIHKLLGSKGRPGTNYGITAEGLLEVLRRLLKRRGYLSEALIGQTKGVPAPCTYIKQFGSILRAYELMGYQPEKGSHQQRWSRTWVLSDQELLEALRSLLRRHGYLTEKLIDRNGETPTSPTYARRFGSLERSYELIGYLPPKRGNQFVGNRAKRTREAV